MEMVEMISLYYLYLFKNFVSAINIGMLLFKRKSWMSFSSIACCFELFGGSFEALLSVSEVTQPCCVQ